MNEIGDYNLKESQLTKNVDSSRRYMDYGLSSINNDKMRDIPIESITLRIKDSEERIETLLGVIENMTSDHEKKKIINEKKYNKRQTNKNLRKKISLEKKIDLNSNSQKLGENNIKIDFLESIPYSVNTYHNSQNLSTRISTNANNLSNNPNPINKISPSQKGKYNNRDLIIGNHIRSNIRKSLNSETINGIQNINIKNNDNKKLKFKLDLKIDLSNSDKQDLINIINDENVNHFNLINNTKNHHNHSIHSEISDNQDPPIKQNSTQNSNLFLTKLEECGTKYSKFLGLNNKDKNSSNNQTINSNKNNISDKILIDLSNKNSNSNNNINLDGNNIKLSSKIIFDITTPKNSNLITDTLDKNKNSKVNQRMFESNSEKNSRKVISNIFSVKKENETHSKIHNDKKSFHSPSNISSIFKKQTSFTSNKVIDENYDGESEVSVPKNKKGTNKSYFEILDLISKDLNKNDDYYSLKKYNYLPKLSPKNPINNYNFDVNNAILKTNSSRAISILHTEEILSSSNNLDIYLNKEKDSMTVNIRGDDSLNSIGKSIDKIKISKLNNVNKSRIFIDKFLNKCKNEEDYSQIILNKMNGDLSKSPYQLKNEQIQICRNKIVNDINLEIDKNLFFMDNKEINKDKVLLLLSSEGKDHKKKFFIENRNSPLFVGELISKINDEFAFKCKNVFNKKYADINSPKEQEKKRKIELVAGEKNQKRLDLKHSDVEKILFEIEACKNNSLKRLSNSLSKYNKLDPILETV